MSTAADQSKSSPDAAPGGTARATKFLGTVISGRYRLEAIVTERSAFTVYRAAHTLMHKRIAVKLLHPEAAERPSALARFEREALAGAHVDHPNIALAKDFGALDDGSRFLVMEYLEGETLRGAMRGGALGTERALRIARQLALALDAAHAIGIVHTAVIPENVRLVARGGESDVVKLVDFGSALLPPSLAPSSGQPSGVSAHLPTDFDPQAPVAAYTAPEIIEAKTVDGRADLYSLGIVLWEMIAGRRFDVRAGGAPPSLVPIGVSAPIDALIRNLAVPAPEGRMGRAVDVVEAIDAALAAARPPRASMADSGPFDATVLSSRSPKLVAASSAPATTERVPAANPLGAARLQAGRLAELPPAIRVCILGAVGIVGVVVLAVAFRSTSAEEALLTDSAATASASAPTDRRKVGSPPATSVADVDRRTKPTDVPRDERRPSESASALSERLMREVRAGQPQAAVATLEQLLDEDPKAGEDGEVRATVVKLSQRVTQVRGDAPGRYFDILSKRMGTVGIDILFEIIATRGESDAAQQATRILRDPAWRERGTAAFRIAYDLRMAKGCNERIALLDRVRTEGDKRTLRPLLLLSDQCGRRDAECCERNDPRVREALDAVRSRSRESD